MAAILNFWLLGTYDCIKNSLNGKLVPKNVSVAVCIFILSHVGPRYKYFRFYSRHAACISGFPVHPTVSETASLRSWSRKCGVAVGIFILSHQGPSTSTSGLEAAILDFKLPDTSNSIDNRSLEDRLLMQKCGSSRWILNPTYYTSEIQQLLCCNCENLKCFRFWDHHIGFLDSARLHCIAVFHSPTIFGKCPQSIPLNSKRLRNGSENISLKVKLHPLHSRRVNLGDQ
jgi:hypothetical protein